MDSTKSYWMEANPLQGSLETPKNSKHGLCVIGSGLSGVSCAYWLSKSGFDNVTILDFEPEKAATYRNCGHILYGTVESMKALHAIHGKDIARDVWAFSINICHQVRQTMEDLKLDAEYKQDGYLVISVDETEDQEIKESIQLLNEMDFESSYKSKKELNELGFKNVFGARFEQGSAQAHPVKFRNGVLRYCLENGIKYYSGIKVTEVEGYLDGVLVNTEKGELQFDAVVIAANAYNPLLSRFFKERKLIDPYRGQIITSKPLKEKIKVTYPHSFDHGYEYALRTQDNRLMIGGWRNHSESGEKGTYEIIPNSFIEDGLKEFTRNHYDIKENIEWEYSWAGIMAASSTGFPFIGPTTHPQIYTCSGYTGHGFSWAHGSAKLLVDIILGNPVPDIAKLFRPIKL